MISRSIGLMRAARSRRWTRLELPRARVMPAVNITSHREDAYSRGTVEPEPSKSARLVEAPLLELSVADPEEMRNLMDDCLPDLFFYLVVARAYFFERPLENRDDAWWRHVSIKPVRYGEALVEPEEGFTLVETGAYDVAL